MTDTAPAAAPSQPFPQTPAQVSDRASAAASGPFASKTLADFDAEVVQVEPPATDARRLAAKANRRRLLGEPGRVPARTGVSLGDTLARLHGMIGVRLALQARTSRARQMIQQITTADGLVLSVPGAVPELSATPGAICGLPPTLGQHTAQVPCVAGWRRPAAGGRRAGR